MEHYNLSCFKEVPYTPGLDIWCKYCNKSYGINGWPNGHSDHCEDFTTNCPKCSKKVIVNMEP